MIAHWDEVERQRYEWEPETAAWWTNLGGATGTVQVGVKRMDVDPDKLSVPLHLHSKEEEIAFVLGGTGYSWQGESMYEVRAGDCIVYVADRDAHTLVGGSQRLEVLVFGTRDRGDLSYLPRTGRGHVGGFWFDVTYGVRPPEQPGRRPAPSAERPANIVNLDDLDGPARELGASAGSIRTGLNHVHLDPGERGPPPHCHSAEEEIFVVLEGDGVLELWPTPATHRLHPDFEYQEHTIRPGHVISRPPGTRIAHALVAGDSGMTYLAYGTREPNDVSYYPRSNKIYWRGVGLIARVEPLDYDDGEPED